jgi:hypothetical protein
LLITLSSFLITFFFGVDCIDAGEAFSGNDDACGESGYQASKAVIERRFLLSIATLKGRSSTIWSILIGSNQGLTTTTKKVYNDQCPAPLGASQALYSDRDTFAFNPSSNKMVN